MPSIFLRRGLRPTWPALLLASAITAGQAAPITPTSDAQVIETLPGGAARAEERQLKRELSQQPKDPKVATQLAAAYLAQARNSGDPRAAGQALAVLKPWAEPTTAPLEVLLMQATLRQYLHDFDGAASLLTQLLARDPKQAQAWLTLATIRRVQGRYADSDKGCAKLAELRIAIYAAACLAENDALRGDYAPAREALQRLLADRELDADSRNWLLTTQAELEERAGNAAAADAAYRAALDASDDAYSRIAYADFLIEQRREADALALLRDRPRDDAVLLRLAIAGTRARSADAAKDAADMRARIEQAALRPEAQGVHAREQAMFALRVDGQAARALELARLNVQKQREPIDLLIFAQAARAAGQPAALEELERLRQETGLQDSRLAGNK